jgi:MFS transporter, DHA1 family, multidrug resistance protein
MADIIRDSTLGAIIRLATGNRILKYPEERDDFVCPASYKNPDTSQSEDDVVIERLPEATLPPVAEDSEKPKEEIESPLEEEIEAPSGQDADAASTSSSSAASNTPEMNKIETAKSELGRYETVKSKATTLNKVGTRTALAQSVTRQDLEQAFTNATMPREPTRPIQPERLLDGTILVDWYTTDDPENPQNWSFKKKCFVTFQIWWVVLS